MTKIAVIIGAGPAGLTAAYELLLKTNIKPIIIEKSTDIGGLSKTINYKGNRIDIGGHRFFSKSDRVTNWWLEMLPLERTENKVLTINYHNKEKSLLTDQYRTADSGDSNNIMLIRKRVSRIYYLKKFFDYPISLSLDTINKLGIQKVVKIFFSYLFSKAFPSKKEDTLEDFFINRFGRNLYLTFFKEYTEKVWGKSCKEIPAQWGAQRIKELSIAKAVLHAAKEISPFKKASIAQKDVSTSLIQHFLYPKYGPGHLWEEVARKIVEKGGEIHTGFDVTRINRKENTIHSVECLDANSGNRKKVDGDYFFSTMPVKELILAFNGPVPENVAQVAASLEYREFITVGLLVRKMKVKNGDKIEDNWIYIQESEVKLGRLQIFNNWSPYMVKDPDTIWLGLEYFCNADDEFWNLSNERIAQIAISEMEKIDLVEKTDVLDHVVIKVEKAYPAYFGGYDQFDVIRDYVDKFENLFLIGRNGMHKYNNADHSMLTAMTAVDNIIQNNVSKENIWRINTEQDYQE